MSYTRAAVSLIFPSLEEIYVYERCYYQTAGDTMNFMAEHFLTRLSQQEKAIWSAPSALLQSP